jgi:hypothetical protein
LFSVHAQLWILTHTIKDVVFLTFSATRNDGSSVELATNRSVTDGNKTEYAELLVEYKLNKEIEKPLQVCTHCRWLPVAWAVTPSRVPVCSRFCKDWHTSFPPTCFARSRWQSCGSCCPARHSDCGRNGTVIMPLVANGAGGFAALHPPFTLQRAESSSTMLPSTSVCYNLMKLPPYESPELLAKKLRLAMSEGASGFAFK